MNLTLEVCRNNYFASILHRFLKEVNFVASIWT